MAAIEPMLAVRIAKAIEGAVGRPFRVRTIRDVSGGSIHRTSVLADGKLSWFVKTNSSAFAAHFAAEFDGLAALRDARVRAPEPIVYGTVGEVAFLVMEHLAIQAGTPMDPSRLATMLVNMHATTGDAFGWHADNFIGATPQSNARELSWIEFFREMRLAPQLVLAERNGHKGMLQLLGERVLDAMPTILGDHSPEPSLVHGDLWCGNAAALAGGTPAIFDPAIYFGDRETDVAMMELFGGFPADFFRVYFEHLPVNEGYPLRRDLYNLYHVLNHLNLFGERYLRQAEGIMARLLARVE